MDLDLDLRLVRYVVAVAEELNFARAAGRLHISQQTLSAQIAALERRLGSTLFVRDRHHVELTAAGAVFADQGRRLLADAADLVATVQASTDTIRIDVVTEGLVSGVLAAKLRSRLTDVSFEVFQGHGLGASLPRLVAGSLDLAIGHLRGFPGSLPEGVDQMPVRLQEVGVLLPERHPLAEWDVVPVGDLARWPLLIHTATEAPEWLYWNESVVEKFGLRVGHRQHGHGRGAVAAAVVAVGEPSLAPKDVPVPAGTTMRPISGPALVCEFAMAWRRTSARRSEVSEVLREAHTIVAEEGWLKPPGQSWWMPDRSSL